MSDLEPIPPSDQEKRARAMADVYLKTLRTEGNRAKARALTNDPAKRKRALKRMAKRIAKAMFAKAQFDGSPIALKECEFILKELFDKIDQADTLEVVQMMRLVTELVGFRRDTKDAIRQKGPTIPRVTFRTVEAPKPPVAAEGTPPKQMEGTA